MRLECNMGLYDLLRVDAECGLGGVGKARRDVEQRLGFVLELPYAQILCNDVAGVFYQCSALASIYRQLV